MTAFTKRGFANFCAARYGISRDEGERLFTLIGTEIQQALDSGDIAKIFGIGTLKIVKKNSPTEGVRLRFRPSPAMRSKNVGTSPVEPTGNDAKEGDS